VSPSAPLVVLALLCLAQAGELPPPPARPAARAASPAAPAPAPTSPAASRTPAPSLTRLWGEYLRVEATGNADEATRRFAEIRRLRIERNIESLDTVGLGLVEQGAARLQEREREAAETALKRAVDLAPGLPDGHYGLSVVRLRRGPLGVVPSLRAMASGIAAFLPTARGQLRFFELLVVAGLVAGLAVTWTLAVSLALRHGGLLRHDLGEWLGPAQSRSAALALFLLLLLLPLASFQGWGWLPLWWLALLFSYFGRAEKLVAVLALAGVVITGSGLGSLEKRLQTARNPLFWAAMTAVEGEPGPPEADLIEAASRRDPEDRDLAYLLGAAWRRVGREGEAALLYQRLLQENPGDPVARNNLADLEYASGQVDQALARYRAGADAGGPPDIVATFFYNLSLAHLRKFEYQAYNEARSNADRLAPGRVSDYDRWRYDSGDYAVVDLGLSREEVWHKFAGSASGVVEKNVFGKGPFRGLDVSPAVLVNRFSGFAILFLLVVVVVGRLRGPRAFTVHCSMCGTAFCRHCHLGSGTTDLCSQCHHLFVVRDGVSGPARNRKMSEVQQSETHRGRVFRVLSVVSPGAGHLYLRWTFAGLLLAATWYGVVGVLAASEIVPFTEVARPLTPPWGAVVVGTLLVVIWVLANRLRPDLEAAIPSRRGGRRGRRGQGQG
jgi:tetratricopeptide (TPR) repeat protein